MFLPTGKDRRDRNSLTARNRANANLTQRIAKFSTQIGHDYVYRIPLNFLSNVRKINQTFKIDLKIMCSLERLMI